MEMILLFVGVFLSGGILISIGAHPAIFIAWGIFWIFLSLKVLEIIMPPPKKRRRRTCPDCRGPLNSEELEEIEKVKLILNKYMREQKSRESNETIQKAWEEYQILIELIEGEKRIDAKLEPHHFPRQLW